MEYIIFIGHILINNMLKRKVLMHDIQQVLLGGATL